jgi:phosphopantothenoylcysteine decarboxylase/phosphopantothenate--cysteine ligase
MYEAVMDNFEDYEVIIKSAAVVDFRPKDFCPWKIKKENNKNLVLELEPTPDILAELGKRKGSRILVGFAAETDQLIENAQEKLLKKNLDLIVANDVTQPGAGFRSDTNVVKIIDSSGRVRGLPLMSKDVVADIILNEIATLLKKRKGKKPWPEDWD